MGKKKLVGWACDKVVDKLPVSDRAKNEGKAACKVIAGGALGGTFKRTISLLKHWS